jgi:2,3-bisphosphoglycerate-independent phosphoglycerate mutase
MRGTDRTILWLLLDGVADRPSRELDGQTPLEAAHTPNLDRLAAEGINGTMDVSTPGTPLSSDRAHTLLWGYDHDEVPGRGVLEARGLDVDVPVGAVACSASFASVERTGQEWTVTDRHLRELDTDYSAHATRVASFSTTVDGADTGTDTDTSANTDIDIEVSFQYTWKNRGIVVLDSLEQLSPDVTDVDPFEVGAAVARPEPLDAACDPVAAQRTADALAAYTRVSTDRLASTPVDIVLAKWAGTPEKPTQFATRHGLDACCLTPKPVLSGLATTLGMSVETPPDSYDERADAALDALATHDFVHVHYPEPDEVSHAAGPREKRDEIAAIDASLSDVADRALADDELVTVVTADHTTPSTENVVHSGEPVPVTMVAATVRTDDVSAVGERPAATGGLGRIRGRDLLRLCRASADRVLLDGLRRSPAVRDYPNQPSTPLEREGDD